MGPLPQHSPSCQIHGHMRVDVLFLIVLSVAMTACAQVLLKIGMSLEPVRAASHSGEWLRLAGLLAHNPWVVGGLSLYGLGALAWLLVLSQVELSFAYPFVGLGFVITLLLSRWLLRDTINLYRLAGTLLISLGVVLVARGG